ncbi:hypothetical protein ACRSLK_01495 [Halopseudomonas pachastrellae]|uniref:hypothetical protein n=1 Tax=Halopseudomonas pachastrellae TaxID=254161 RepID=UPI003D7E6C08
MEGKNISSTASMLLAAIVLSMLSLVPAIVISLHGIPLNPGAPKFIPDTSKIYRMEDVIESEERAIKGFEAEVERLRALEGTGYYADLIHKRSVWFSWLPWILAPFLFQIARTPKAYLLLLLPAFLTALGAFSVVELLLFLFAMFTGKRVFKNKRLSVTQTP